MYESFFGMVNTPFARNLPSDVLFENPAMQDVLGRLRYVADKKLFAVVTSDPGCGKSTLLRKFNEQLPRDDYIMLYLSDSKLTPKWFYKGLLEQLGMESGFYRGDAKRQLQKAIEIVQGIKSGLSAFSTKHISWIRRCSKNSASCSTIVLIPKVPWRSYWLARRNSGILS